MPGTRVLEEGGFIWQRHLPPFDFLGVWTHLLMATTPPRAPGWEWWRSIARYDRPGKNLWLLKPVRFCLRSPVDTEQTTGSHSRLCLCIISGRTQIVGVIGMTRGEIAYQLIETSSWLVWFVWNDGYRGEG